MKDLMICLFKVEFYDDINGETKQECGLTFADSFNQAADYLETVLYGDNLSKILHMELLDTCPVFSEDVWNQMRKELTAK